MGNTSVCWGRGYFWNCSCLPFIFEVFVAFGLAFQNFSLPQFIYWLWRCTKLRRQIEYLLERCGVQLFLFFYLFLKFSNLQVIIFYYFCSDTLQPSPAGLWPDWPLRPPDAEQIQASPRPPPQTPSQRWRDEATARERRLHHPRRQSAVYSERVQRLQVVSEEYQPGIG